MIHALHGNFGLPSDWDASLPPGVPARAWHLWEIRRHYPEARTLTGFATWFNNQIEALPPDPRRILAGYSLGGRLALHVLLDRPALWYRALLLSTHPGLTTEAARADRLTHDLSWRDRCLHEPWEQVCNAWNAQPVLQDNQVIMGPEALDLWRAEIADAFGGWSLGHQQDLLPLLAQLPCRTTWLAGEEDVKFSALARAAAMVLPSGNHRTIGGAGHRLPTGNPAEVGAAFSEILS